MAFRAPGDEGRSCRRRPFQISYQSDLFGVTASAFHTPRVPPLTLFCQKKQGNPPPPQKKGSLSPQNPQILGKERPNAQKARNPRREESVRGAESMVMKFHDNVQGEVRVNFLARFASKPHFFHVCHSPCFFGSLKVGKSKKSKGWMVRDHGLFSSIATASLRHHALCSVGSA